MARLEKDLKTSEEKFADAVRDMKALKTRTNNLKKKLKGMYDDLASAIKTPAGDELKIEAKDVLLEPIEDMAKVVGHISDTLDTVVGTGYYKDVFNGFDELKNIL